MSKKVFLIISLFLTVQVIAGICFGDVIILKTKDPKTNQQKTVEGKILEEDKEKVTLETYPGTTMVILKRDIVQINKGKPPWEVYEEQKAKIKDTAAEHCKLGKWCQQHGLKNEAKQEWEKTIELDPDHSEARKLLGYIKDGTKEGKANWRLEKEVMIEKGMVPFEGKWVRRDKFEELMKQGGYTFTLKAGIEDDVDEKFLNEFGERMKVASAWLWKGTRGQFYIAEVTITDKTSQGNIVVPKGHAHTADYSCAQSGLGGKGVVASFRIPGETDPYTFLHEFGHAAFGLPDEKVPNCCRICIMRGPRKDGDWKKDPQFCTEENHERNGPACWTLILAQWPKLVGPDNDPCIPIDEIPQTKINIINK